MKVYAFMNSMVRWIGKMIHLFFLRKELVDIEGKYQAVGLKQTKENIFHTVIS